MRRPEIRIFIGTMAMLALLAPSVKGQADPPAPGGFEPSLRLFAPVGNHTLAGPAGVNRRCARIPTEGVRIFNVFDYERAVIPRRICYTIKNTGEAHVQGHVVITDVYGTRRQLDRARTRQIPPQGLLEKFRSGL